MQNTSKKEFGAPNPPPPPPPHERQDIGNSHRKS